MRRRSFCKMGAAGLLLPFSPARSAVLFVTVAPPEDPFAGYANRYMTPTGGGAHDGTSYADAWSPTEAVANATAGQRVWVQDGTYTLSSKLTVANSGTNDLNRVVFQGDTGTPTFFGPNTDAAFDVNGRSFVTFYQLKFTNQKASSIEAGQTGADDITVDGCYVVDMADDAGGDNRCAFRLFNGRNFIIRNCIIDVNRAYYHGLQHYDAYDYIWENNYIIMKAAQVVGSVAFMYSKRPNQVNIGTSTIRRNICIRKNSATGGVNGIWYGLAGGANKPDRGDADIYENLIVNGTNGIEISQPTTATDATGIFTIYNNNFVNNSNANSLAYGVNVNRIKDIRIHSNIIGCSNGSANIRSALISGTNAPIVTEIDYNFYDAAGSLKSQTWGLNGDFKNTENDWQDVTSANEHLTQDYPDRHGRADNSKAIYIDPLFTNRASGDFTLASGSPGIGAGKSGQDCGCYVGNRLGPPQDVLDKWGITVDCSPT